MRRDNNKKTSGANHNEDESRSVANSDSIQFLVSDIVQYDIFKFLSPTDLAHLAQSCQEFYRLFDNCRNQADFQNKLNRYLDEQIRGLQEKYQVPLAPDQNLDQALLSTEQGIHARAQAHEQKVDSELMNVYCCMLGCFLCVAGTCLGSEMGGNMMSCDRAPTPANKFCLWMSRILFTGLATGSGYLALNLDDEHTTLDQGVLLGFSGLSGLAILADVLVNLCCRCQRQEQHDLERVRDLQAAGETLNHYHRLDDHQIDIEEISDDEANQDAAASRANKPSSRPK